MSDIETEHTPTDNRIGYDGFVLQEKAPGFGYMDIAFSEDVEALTKWGQNCKDHRGKSDFRIADRMSNIVWKS